MGGYSPRHPDHGGGRLYAPDERDAGYPLRALLSRSVATTLPRRRMWRRGPILDQGPTPRCVAFTGRQWLTSWPVPDKGGPVVDALYAGAQANDEWEGSDYDGTSARGLMKYLQGLGYVEAYHWASSAQEVLEYVLTRGSVLLGTPLYEGMEWPEAGQGFVMRPTGRDLGGHAMLIRGAERGSRRFRVTNSWGAGWADRGEAWLHADDLDLLLARGADVCAPVQARPGGEEAR